MYIDKNGKVDLVKLRAEILVELQSLYTQADYALEKQTHKRFWEYFHQVIIREAGDEQEKIAWLDVEAQIQGLPHMIETWIRTAVESPERLEMFIRIKASEIKSLDEEKDYYLALGIRHDQLVGLVTVLKHLISHLHRFVLMRAEEVIEDEIFLGIEKHSIEEQIYLEAEKVYKQRVKL
jgi:hypothetical protein